METKHVIITHRIDTVSVLTLVPVILLLGSVISVFFPKRSTW